MTDSCKTGALQRHVYLIDDDAAVRNAIARSLERLDHKVHRFESANSFLEGASLSRPAVMLVDMRMPGISGIELQVKLAAAGWSSPVIFISGESTATQSAIAREQGAFGFLSKPFGLEELARMVDAALEKDALSLATGGRGDQGS